MQIFSSTRNTWERKPSEVVWMRPSFSRAADSLCYRSHLPAGSLKRTSRPLWDTCSNRPLILWRSQTQSPSASQLYRAEVITPQENARKPSAPNTHLFRIRVSILEYLVLCAVNVGKHSGTNPHLLYTREPTLENGFMCVVNLENPSGKAQLCVNIKAFRLEQCNIIAANVGNS